MKKLLALILALCLSVFCGCSNAEETPTTVPTTQATVESTEAATETTAAPTTEAPTEAPTEPPVVYSNPLTGEILDAPLTTRIFAVSIDNVPGALPHVNVDKADMVFEMFVNDHSTRCFALYTDVTSVEKIGAVRSMRINFTDMAQGYDAIVAHAGGSNMVLSDAKKSGIDHFNVDVSKESYYAARDQERISRGIGRVHSLVAKGEGIYKLAQDKDMRVTLDETKNYGMQFSENACPADGVDANIVTVYFKHGAALKPSTLTYSQDLGEYIFTQYGKQADSVTEENMESFKNVFVILTKVTNVDVYHIAETLGSGEGYFACDGKMIPIQWHRENETDPYSFTLTDGTPLVQGIGSSYVAIAPQVSPVTAE